MKWNKQDKDGKVNTLYTKYCEINIYKCFIKYFSHSIKLHITSTSGKLKSKDLENAKKEAVEKTLKYLNNQKELIDQAINELERLK